VSLPGEGISDSSSSDEKKENQRRPEQHSARAQHEEERLHGVESHRVISKGPPTELPLRETAASKAESESEPSPIAAPSREPHAKDVFQAIHTESLKRREAGTLPKFTGEIAKAQKMLEERMQKAQEAKAAQAAQTKAAPFKWNVRDVSAPQRPTPAQTAELAAAKAELAAEHLQTKNSVSAGPSVKERALLFAKTQKMELPRNR